MPEARIKIYPQDRLTAAERFQSVVRLKQPDRVPLSMMLYYYAPLHVGARMSDYMKRPDVYMRVMKQVFQDLGPWDIYYNINPVSRLLYSYVMMMRILWPGVELPENEMAKIDEIQYMQAEDYDRILNSPRWISDIQFRVEMLSRFCPDCQDDSVFKVLLKLVPGIVRQVYFWRKDFEWWRQQGLVPQIGCQAEMPFDTFSQARNVIQFSMDLFKIPEKIRESSLHVSKGFAELNVLLARIMGVKTVQCYCHRTSNSFISPQQFERLAFPSMEMIVNRIVDAGMTPILHCDGDWLKNLKVMRRLPAKKIVLQLDGLTDIFQAKQEIGDRMCLFGDVPAAKLVSGSPGEVEEYCHRLIEEVGCNGGFILAGGCEIPPNAKPENLRAMVRSVVKYGYYGENALAAENRGG